MSAWGYFSWHNIFKSQTEVLEVELYREQFKEVPGFVKVEKMWNENDDITGSAASVLIVFKSQSKNNL